MRTLYSCLAFLALLLPVSASAQSGMPTHPTDASATLIASFTTTVFFSPSDIGDTITSATATTSKDREVGGHTNICVWRISNGSIEYVVNTDSVRLDGAWEEGDTISTENLFGHLSRAAVAQGIARGYSSCVGTGTTTARVLTASCVSRSGRGTSTRFSAATPLTVIARTYDISCENGAATPSITLVPSSISSPVCGNGYQSTR